MRMNGLIGHVAVTVSNHDAELTAVIVRRADGPTTMASVERPTSIIATNGELRIATRPGDFRVSLAPTFGKTVATGDGRERVVLLPIDTTEKATIARLERGEPHTLIHYVITSRSWQIVIGVWSMASLPAVMADIEKSFEWQNFTKEV